jgi:hypothetical protein
MSKEKRFLDISNWIFWILLSVILLMLLPYFKNDFYNDQPIEKWLSQFDTISPKPEPITDTSSLKKSDTTSILKWCDFNNEWFKIKYKHPKNALIRSKTNRLAGQYGIGIYDHMYRHDKVFLSNLISQMKKHIKQQSLNYIEALEYVCSSIQYFPYTLITNSNEPCPCQTNFGYYYDDCSYKTGNGCCSGVDPFAVYSPFEFVYKHTGDCDTRSLTAFTLLKNMGFDVAVMVSEKESHSVLGVVIPGRMHSNLSKGSNTFGKKYLLWELTSRDWRLGDQVEGNDWFAALE